MHDMQVFAVHQEYFLSLFGVPSNVGIINESISACLMTSSSPFGLQNASDTSLWNQTQLVPGPVLSILEEGIFYTTPVSLTTSQNSVISQIYLRQIFLWSAYIIISITAICGNIYGTCGYTVIRVYPIFFD